MERMPWDPVRDLLTMQERLESLFGRASPGWVPPVDLSESPERYLLTIELPGFDRTNVSIDLDLNILRPSCVEVFVDLAIVIRSLDRSQTLQNIIAKL